jgi:uncharacterized protein (DUF433 family)
MSASRSVEIDPRRSFGRPIVIGTRVPAEELSSRFSAADTVDDIARDFRQGPEIVQGVLQWEMARREDAPAA